MGSDVQAVILYDFLYKDSDRISSYYAQVFSGRLLSQEQQESESSGVEKAGTLNVYVTKADAKHIQGTQTSAKRIIDPHDVIATDVLSFLANNATLQADISSAPHGSLVITQGTLVFIDRSMLELAIVTFQATLKQEQSKPRAQRDMEGIELLNLIIPFLSKLSIPSAFLIQTATGTQVVGTLKEEGMQEPIATYYFKHGTAGLADVYLVGIKEVPTEALTLPNTQMIGVGQIAAQALSDMLFPPDALRVTPVAMFRKLQQGTGELNPTAD